MNITMPYRKTAYTLITTLLVLLTFSANLVEAHECRGKHRGPPPEATEACAALVAGDSCAFTGRRDDEITGTCRITRREELACAPPKRDRRHGKDRPKPQTSDNSAQDNEGNGNESE